jgi:hypothetical protein
MFIGQTPVCRGHPAPGVAVVHDVVVQQGRGLEELHRGRGANDCLVVRPAASAIAPVEECRPKSFSTLQQSTDRRHQRGELVADLGEDPRLGGDFGIDSDLHACAQVTGVQWIRQAVLSDAELTQPTCCPVA